MLTTTDFRAFLSNEIAISDLGSENLEAAISKFPYSANLHILRALSLYESKNSEFPKALEHAAARTISRHRLKYLIEGPPKLDFEWIPKEPEPETQDPIGDRSEEDIQSELMPETESVIALEMVEPEPITESLDEVVEEAEMGNHFVEPPQNEFGFVFVKVKRTKPSPKTKKLAQSPFDLSVLATKKPIKGKKVPDVIEKFLEAAPSISSPRIDFGQGSPQPDLAAASGSLAEEIVTENMALIYLKQRNFQKALDIYQKLQLKFPEKSAYFAALIKNLENPIV